MMILHTHACILDMIAEDEEGFYHGGYRVSSKRILNHFNLMKEILYKPPREHKTYDGTTDSVCKLYQ